MAISKKSVELLLVENVPNLGIVGDVVTVKPGYARNYLLPHGLATVPTEGRLAKLQERRAEVERELAALRSEQEKLIEKLAQVEITLKRSANEEGHLYGSVSQHDIAGALTDAGYTVTDRDVRIGNPIKHLDTYQVPVQLTKDLRTEVKVVVVSDKTAEELEAEAKIRAEMEAEEIRREQEEDAQDRKERGTRRPRGGDSDTSIFSE